MFILLILDDISIRKYMRFLTSTNLHSNILLEKIAHFVINDVTQE